MNELKKIAKREYYLVKGLEFLALALIFTFLIYSALRLSQSNTFQIASTLKSSYLVYGILFASIGLMVGAVIWRSYRIPPLIQATLITYYQNMGYSTKKSLFHTVKVNLSPHLFFKIKLNLFKRVSDESCLFYLESMRLSMGLQEQQQFQRLAERYFLKSNLNSQKFSTSCELEEIHGRSLLLIQALEDFSKNRLL